MLQMLEIHTQTKQIQKLNKNEGKQKYIEKAKAHTEIIIK